LFNIKKISTNKNLLIAFFIVVTYKILLLENHNITYDELYSLINYTNYYTLFLKDNLNNHIINSIFGTLIGTFSFEIVNLRFISFIFFILGLFYLDKTTKSKATLIIFLLLFLIGNNLYVYSFLYRGYPYNFFLFALAFYILFQKNTKNDYLVLLIFSTLTFLAPSNILLIWPLLFVYKKQLIIKKIFLYYLIPVGILLMINILVTGIYELRDEVLLETINYHFLFSINNLWLIFINGLSAYVNLIFGFYEKQSLLDHYNTFLRDDKIFLLITFLNLIYLVFKFYKKKIDKFDKVFFLFLVLFIFLSNAPHSRVYYPFYAFYFLYLDKIINELKIEYLYKSNFKIIILSTIVFLIANINFDTKLLNNIDINIHYSKMKNITAKHNDIISKDCSLDYSITGPLEKDLFYYNRLIMCKKKLNIFEVKEFQKLRE